MKKHRKENAAVLVGGFIDGKLIYIFRFPFNSKPLVDRLRDLLRKKYPDGKDVSGDWLRSATFRLRDYKDISTLNVTVFVDNQTLDFYQPYITKPLYDFLEEKINESRKV